MNRRERHKTERRQRIAAATLDALTENELDALTVAVIAERADVSVATLYNLIGRVGDILDYLVSQLLDELIDALSEEAESHPERFFEDLADANRALLQRNETGYRRALRAWFRFGLAGASSDERTAQDRRSFALMGRVLDGCRRRGLIHPRCDTRLLGEEILQAHMRLLESWSAGRFGLAEFHRRALYHAFCLLRAWAKPAYARELGERLWQLQAELAPSKSGTG